MSKNIHEIRDPIHVFIRLYSNERSVLDSKYFQRMRHIHQLAMTCLVYPGATHRRFEHSLGTMELASRVYDIVTRPENLASEVRDTLPQLEDPHQREYWRQVLRVAALCHDLGHLPFSHAAEKELLPPGWSHEKITASIIRSPGMLSVWNELKIGADDIVKLAIGPKEATDLEFSRWEMILAEIIVGDAFGVDRMDYLLRDSYHTGVAYGRFDHYRLLDTLRILPVAPSDGNGGRDELSLGVEEGGIQSAEALALARYFMYSQVYFHAIRRIYDIHLKDFLREWLENGMFSTDVERHLALTDVEVTAALMVAAKDPTKPGHLHAKRICERQHFKVLYSRVPADIETNADAGKAIFDAACGKFGAKSFRHDLYRQKGGLLDFPVKMRDGSIASSLSVSSVLPNTPIVSVDYVFADRDILAEAGKWLSKNKAAIIAPKIEE